ncbi:MAG: sensor histidine kinase [Xanthomonadales bacterium]|nr:sensor histidine kinase [Xanthomonadales bacterium]NNL96041.1 sensor histidine kinase [Xanthomonadales bacterium]
MKLFDGKYRPLDLMRHAGMFTWFCTTIPLFFIPFLRETPLPEVQYTAWWLLQLFFGLIYWQLARHLARSDAVPMRLVYLLLLSGSALAISAASESALGGILLLIVAGLLPWAVEPVLASAWLIFQNVLLAWIVSRIPTIEFTDAALTAGVFLGISLFVFVGSVATLRQNDARDQLRKMNSELRATQALLTENTRMAERLRIARELHDLVGHHLTALTLNLEVVTHLVDGKVLEHVQQARSLAKMLLADVREVVSDMRRGDQVDLGRALKTLVEGVPEPRIHLDLPSDLIMIDPHQAHILLRCVQEIITNSVRHANASNLWIRLSMSRDGVAMSARDDGRGVSRVQAGNGLRGMQERLTQLGGKLEVESQKGAGFTLHAWVPAEA